MFVIPHSFNVSIEEAKSIQHELHALIRVTDALRVDNRMEFIGGADVAFAESGAEKTLKLVNDRYNLPISTSLFEDSAKRPYPGKPLIALAGIVIIHAKSGTVVEKSTAAAEVTFPYIPGFLSFREGPAILAALRKLSQLPDVMIYDGCGIAHPRGVGLASHMAVLTGIPSIGCAKSLLCGTCEEPGLSKGAWTFITCDAAIVGTCLRTRDNVKPVYVSPGSGFSIETARDFVLSLAYKYRLPEPTRLAHNLVTLEKRKYHVRVS